MCLDRTNSWHNQLQHSACQCVDFHSSASNAQWLHMHPVWQHSNKLQRMWSSRRRRTCMLKWHHIAACHATLPSGQLRPYALYLRHCKVLARLKESGRRWHGCMQVHSHNPLHINTASWEPRYRLTNTDQPGKTIRTSLKKLRPAACICPYVMWLHYNMSE